jgi:hypothetical protein
MKYYILAIVLSMFVFLSCTGPTGPQGNPGVANVYVVKYTINYSNWAINTATYSAECQIPVPEITQYVVNAGFTLAYYMGSDGYWYLWDGSEGYDVFRHTIKSGWLYLETYNTNLQPVSGIINNSLLIKIIIIEGTPLAIKLHYNIDYSNYESVKSALNIKD